MHDLTQKVGCCGLVCSLCFAAERYKCVGCRKGGGPYDDCFQRSCTSEKGIDGCWDCNAFPCGNGMFSGSNGYSGLCIAFVQCIRENGIQIHLDHIRNNIGPIITYEDWLDSSAPYIQKVICSGKSLK